MAGNTTSFTDISSMTEAEEFLKASGAFPLNYLNSFALDPATGKHEAWDHNKIVLHYKLRGQFVAKFGFAVITEEVIALLKGYQPILEVGAGSGYWSYELRKAGIDIITTDPGTGSYTHSYEDRKALNGRNWDNKFI